MKNIKSFSSSRSTEQNGISADNKLKTIVWVIHLLSAVLWYTLWHVVVGFEKLVGDIWYVWWTPYFVFNMALSVFLSNEGIDNYTLHLDRETEKLKILDDMSGKLITIIGIAIAVTWYLFKSNYFEQADVLPMRDVLMITGATLFMGILPLYWSRPDKFEIKRLFILRHLKSAAYTQCLSWILVALVKLLYPILNKQIL